MTLDELIEKINRQAPSVEEIVRIENTNEIEAKEIQKNYLLQFEGIGNAYPSLLENLAYQSNLWLLNGFGSMQFLRNMRQSKDWEEFAVFDEAPFLRNLKSGEIFLGSPVEWQNDELQYACAASVEHFLDAMTYLYGRDIENRYRNRPFNPKDIEELSQRSGGEKYLDWWEFFVLHI
jgi:hypothetical protein